MHKECSGIRGRLQNLGDFGFAVCLVTVDIGEYLWNVQNKFPAWEILYFVISVASDAETHCGRDGLKKNYVNIFLCWDLEDCLYARRERLM